MNIEVQKALEDRELKKPFKCENHHRGCIARFPSKRWQN